MHILMMAQHYAPENVSGAVLATELAEDFVHRGNQVTFVTCAPNYPHGRVFAGYRNSFHHQKIQNGVKIIRVWSNITPNKCFWSRIVNYGTFSAMSLFGGLLAGKPDVIFSYSPPLPLGVSAWLISRIHRVPWILRVEDLYPDVAVATGVLKNQYAIALLTKLERFIYRKATHVSLISEGFRQNLLRKGIPDEKLSVAPVWADPDVIRPLNKNNKFRKDHGLQGKFVVLYAGNMGITSLLEDVIAAATLLQNEPEIVFLLIGEGVKKEILLKQASNLQNVHFLPYQPRTVLPEMMAAADVSLVTLNPEAAAYSMPNKTFSIMASARPLLAITPQESEIARLIEMADCGINVSPNCPVELVETILKLKRNPRTAINLGKNGRTLLETSFSRRVCVDLFEAILKRVKV